MTTADYSTIYQLLEFYTSGLFNKICLIKNYYSKPVFSLFVL